MGIVNLTPDSFSGVGPGLQAIPALEYAMRLVAQGADLLDLGGESSRPGAEPVSLDLELERVLPAIEALSAQVAVPISIDTTKAEVARQALARGATVINDISALQADPEMATLAAESGAGVVLMHMQGSPRTMQINPHYADVSLEVYEFLARRVDWAQAHGIARERIAIDPGIGFGKTDEHNLQLLRNLERFDSLGCVLLVGVSRKGFLGKLTGRPISERVPASVAAALAACQRGARVVRVHDVAETVDAIRVWGAVHGWEVDR
jgi:dihydropteroate synthase